MTLREKKNFRIEREVTSAPEGAHARAGGEERADAGAGEDAQGRGGPAEREGRANEGAGQGTARDRQRQAPNASAGDRLQHSADGRANA